VKIYVLDGGGWGRRDRGHLTLDYRLTKLHIKAVNEKQVRSLGRPRHRWEDNIKMDLKEVGGSCGDWMEVAQDRDRWRALVGTVRNLGVPKMRGIS
jgi:hypothetical protein